VRETTTAQRPPQGRLDPASAALLDNPIWSALTTDHAPIAMGGEAARRYPDRIGPLSAMPAQTQAGYEALHSLTPVGGAVALFFLEPLRPPQGWSMVRGGQLVQMVAPRPRLADAPLPVDAELRALAAEDAPAMVELAELTEPGPFRLGTIALGGYFGIFLDGRLAAMAGRRMAMPGFVEVSAVCTHPEARGRGFASVLMSRVMAGIVDEGRVPFLHALASNDSAVRVYERLGFTLRQTFHFAAVRRE